MSFQCGIFKKNHGSAGGSSSKKVRVNMDKKYLKKKRAWNSYKL